jgi:hypothetical protein
MTTEDFAIYSTQYIDNQDIHTGIISLEHWSRLSEELHSPRLFASIQFEMKSLLCALNCTTIENGFPKGIFLPEWMIPHGVECGTEHTVTIIGVDALPKAEHVVLRPLDSAFYNTDAKEELERNLTKLGCLTKGQLINLPLHSLDGYEMPFYVSDVQPADSVLLDGDEISCEFEEAVDQFDGRPPTPIPEVVPSLASMIPEEKKKEEDTRFQGEGQRLGGEVKKMADGRPWNPYR